MRSNYHCLTQIVGVACTLTLTVDPPVEGGLSLTRDHAGQPWRARQREILSRIVRETEAPTDSLPLIKAPGAQGARRLLRRAGGRGARPGRHCRRGVDGVGECRPPRRWIRSPPSPPRTAWSVARSTSSTRPSTSRPTGGRRRRRPARCTSCRPGRWTSAGWPPSTASSRRIRARQVSPTKARDELDAIITAPHPYKRWIATLAWGALAFATAGTLGGGLLACLVSALSAMTIDRVNRRLNKHGLPFFFQYAVGGAIATAPPLALYVLSPKLGLQFEPTVAIAAGLVVLLAGLSLVGSVGDVITGAPVTAAGRFFELVMMTAATIAGVALVLHLASRFGAPYIAISANAPPALAEVAVRVAFGAASAAAFALACYAERTALVAAAFGGAAGTMGFLLAQGAGVGAVVASFVAAVPVGLVGRLMERRNLTPPLIVSISGIVPLLPGLSLLHGIYAILNDQLIIGLTSVLAALGISTALAAGVALGEWGSWRVRRRRLRVRRKRL